jgi:cell wall-associated NlpC family hydrolase
MHLASLGARLRALTVLLALTAATLVAAGTAPAHASMTYMERFHNKADRVLSVTQNQKGDPYSYGSAGPNRFDCSGLVYYVFHKALGKTLPRVANDQKRATKRIWHRSNLRRGDLVFQTDKGGYAYHVGIYAGHGYFWHAPHTGTVVKKQKMYPAHWAYGRIIMKHHG